METDTYTVSFELAGYQPQSITGVNVFADQNVNISPQLTKSLITIGRVTARSVGGAFQPNQTSDTYTVTSSQIANQLGKTDSVSETNLILTLPGSTRDSSGLSPSSAAAVKTRKASSTKVSRTPTPSPTNSSIASRSTPASSHCS